MIVLVLIILITGGRVGRRSGRRLSGRVFGSVGFSAQNNTAPLHATSTAAVELVLVVEEGLAWWRRKEYRLGLRERGPLPKLFHHDPTLLLHKCR